MAGFQEAIMRLGDYELLGVLVQDEERESLKAWDVPASRRAIVHAIRPSVQPNEARPDLVRMATALYSGTRPAALLFAGELQGRFYVVTEALPECLDIRKWLERQTKSAKADEDFLNPAKTWKPPTKNHLASQSQKQHKEPGDFTVMFSGGVKPSIDPPLKNMDIRVKLDSEGQKEPGDFTRMFDAHQAPNPSRSSPSTPKSNSPSIHTQGISPEPANLMKPTPVAPSAPLRTEIPEPVFPSSKPQWPQPEDVSVPNSAVVLSVPEVAIPKSPITKEQITTDQQGGPSEYTRAVAIHVRQPDVPKPPDLQPAPIALPSTPQPQPVVEKVGKQSYLPLILIMNVLFLAALALILYFAFKK